MEVRALIVTTDNITASMVRRALNSVGVTPEEGVKVESVMDRVRRQHFEAIILDLTVEGAHDLLGKLRTEAASRSAVLFALVNGKNSMREAFQSGATFVLDKPLALDRTLRCFRAAYGLIVGERRRYYRHRISLAVAVARSGGDQVNGSSIDVSTGGMLMELSTPLAEDSQVKLQFGIPGAEEKIGAAAEVIWSKNGKVGLRFTRFTKGSKESLSTWLSQQMERTLGPSQAEKFPATV